MSYTILTAVNPNLTRWRHFGHSFICSPSLMPILVVRRSLNTHQYVVQGHMQLACYYRHNAPPILGMSYRRHLHHSRSAGPERTKKQRNRAHGEAVANGLDMDRGAWSFHCIYCWISYLICWQSKSNEIAVSKPFVLVFNHGRFVVDLLVLGW
jgi:hypothetical protein